MITIAAKSGRHVGLYMAFSTAETLSSGSAGDVGSVEGLEKFSGAIAYRAIEEVVTLIPYLARDRCDMQRAQPFLQPNQERYESNLTRALPTQLSGGSDDRFLCNHDY